MQSLRKFDERSQVGSASNVCLFRGIQLENVSYAKTLPRAEISLICLVAHPVFDTSARHRRKFVAAFVDRITEEMSEASPIIFDFRMA